MYGAHFRHQYFCLRQPRRVVSFRIRTQSSTRCRNWHDRCGACCRLARPGRPYLGNGLDHSFLMRLHDVASFDQGRNNFIQLGHWAQACQIGNASSAVHGIQNSTFPGTQSERRANNFTSSLSRLDKNQGSRKYVVIQHVENRNQIAVTIRTLCDADISNTCPRFDLFDITVFFTTCRRNQTLANTVATLMPWQENHSSLG